MNELEKREEIASLFEIYGSFLSKTQKEVLRDYYSFDLSLAEIANNRASSRAAVEDALKKGEKKLYEFEKALGMLKNRKRLKALFSKAKATNDYRELEDYINGI